MTEMKHSPGPWRNDKYHILDDANNTVALIGWYVDGTEDDVLESDANASLIAAAPEMLPIVAAFAALPINDKTRDDVPVYGLDGGYITHGDVRKARAAIAKAKGVQE